MPTRNVHLTDYLDQFIESGIQSGRFSNASEIVREGLRLLEQREQEDQARLHWLQAAAQEGFAAVERGEFISLHSGEEIAAFVRKIAVDVSAKTPAQAK